jgi:predicted nucleic acid-binding protein
MVYVIDTSVLAKVFLAEPEHERVVALIEACIRGETKLIAPSLLLYEVNNALVSNGVRGAEYTDAIARVMWWMRAKVIEISEPDEDLLRRAEAIASMDTEGKGHISSFDATFHALALMSDAVFVTSDQSYVRKTKALLGSVDLLQDISI